MLLMYSILVYPGICEHKRLKYYCVECKGAGICEHKRRKGGCKDCTVGQAMGKGAISPSTSTAGQSTSISTTPPAAAPSSSTSAGVATTGDSSTSSTIGESTVGQTTGMEAILAMVSEQVGITAHTICARCDEHATCNARGCSRGDYRRLAVNTAGSLHVVRKTCHPLAPKLCVYLCCI